MAKRKRSSDMSSVVAPKQPSTRRRNADPDDDDIICIDLESEPDGINSRRGASSSKKKRIDKETSNGKRQESNGRDSHGDSSVIVPVVDSFKVPQAPRRQQVVPSSSTRSSTTSKSQPRSKSRRVEPTERQLHATNESRKVRRAFIDAIHDALEDASQENTEGMGNLINSFSECIPGKMFFFATRRLPEGAKIEDFSSDSEIEEFARWWLFGITALLFSCPEEEAQNVLAKSKNVLATLCHLLVGGHTSVVNGLGVQLLKILKDVLMSSGDDVETEPVINIELSRRENETSYPERFTFKIKATKNNKWIIPHYIQAISPLITTICYQNVHLFHLFCNFLQKHLVKLVAPETVTTVLASFPSFTLTGAHSFYLTEDTLSSIFKRILTLPTLPKVDLLQTRHCFNQYDFLENQRFVEFMQDSGSDLLKIEMEDILYSNVYAILNAEDLNEVIMQSVGFIIKGFDKSMVDKVVPLSRLISSHGLQMVRHPLLEALILTQMKNSVNLRSGLDNGEACSPITSSNIWHSIFESWENVLSNQYRYLASNQEATGIPECDPLDTYNFFWNTTALIMLSSQIKKNLWKAGDCDVRLNNFELKHLQRWSDVAFQSLTNCAIFNPCHLHHTYYAILDTILRLDSCDWFGVSLSAKFLNNLISIPGWLWLSSFEACIPQKLKPLPMFTRRSNGAQFIRGSSFLTSMAIRTLRLDIFRPWRRFVSEIYLALMSNYTTFKDSCLTIELLRAIGDVSWVFKEVVSLKTTFTFLHKLIQTNLWKADSNVRSALATAITSLPCICHYNVLRNRTDCQFGVPLVSENGCGKEWCKTVALNDEKSESLDDAYIREIINLALPLLKSKFLPLKMTLSDLIPRSHNHVKNPSMPLIMQMVEVALNGHTVLSEEIFRKIGMIVANSAPNCVDDNRVIGGDTYTAQKIFSAAIPQLCKRKESKCRKAVLSLKTREKIIKSIVAFSTVGPMNMCIFVEILRCIIPIVAQTKGNENSATILSQKIVTYFAEVHNCQPHELLTRVRYEIANCIIKSALEAFYDKEDELTQQQQKLHMCVKFIERLKYIGKFRLSFVRYFYPPMMELIVPRLMVNDGRYKFLLTCLASHEKVSEPIMLQEYIMNYFPALLLDHSSETISHCLKFLKTQYAFDAMFAAKQQEQRILNEALCRLGDREEKVQRFLSHLCKWDDQSSKLIYTHGTAYKVTRSELQDLLNKRLLGFFIHLDTKLQSRIETAETKQNILTSFTALMKLMGKSKITPVRSKVYKTLYSATKEGPLYHEVLYNAWKEFANNLDNASFASMTPQIIASILPLRESFHIRSKVDGLISHCVCYKKDLTAIHHQELYFLVDQCEDPDVIQTIRQAVDKMKTKNWADYFNMVVKEASNENPPIRYEAFKKLRDVFRFDWELVEKFVLVKGQQYVSQMISTLLAGLRGTGNSEDEKLRSTIVDCFGSVGALDPVRFRSEDDDGNSKNCLSTSLAISCQMNTFIVLYLGELIREFQEVKDTTNFDYCACLIQIVLKEFKVNPDDANDKIWVYLSKDQQETIMPMFSTKYQMDNGTHLPNIGSPIYLSEHGKSFDSWLINWMCVLITCITEKERHAFNLFRKSMNVLKTNVRIATFIIPFVAMYAIFCATKEQRDDIVSEIRTVLERWVVLDRMKQKAHSIVPIKDSEVEHGLKEEPISVENESIFHSRCTQVIFSILDHLLRSSSLAKRKLGLKRAADASNRRGGHNSKSVSLPMSENDLKAVESVLTEIPLLLISEVSCNCASFPAALYYLEQELKNDPCEETLQTNVDYLQRLYICLDDMDSVGGIAAIRKGDPSFAGQILENIVNGKTQESVKGLEQTAILDTKDFQLHQALVRAYLKVEEPHAAETFIKATLARQPEWEIDLQEVHMEALVKLQKWPEVSNKVDQLETLKKNEFVQEKLLTWNVAIPRIVSKLQRNQTEAAMELLGEVRTGLIAPLVSTCEDMYPYKRAYPHIIKLHILTEIEDAIKLLRKHNVTNGRSGSTQGWVHKEVTRLTNKWKARLWNVSKSRKLMDQILNIRKNIFQILKMAFCASIPACEVLNASIRECWLESARDASKCGDFIRADNCLREAKVYMSPKVMIEEAKILNRKGEKENAIFALQKGIAQYFPQLETWKNEEVPVVLKPSVMGHCSSVKSTISTLPQTKLLCSKALLLLAELCEEQKLLDMEDYIAKYKEAADVYKESEKNFFALASYHDRLWSAADKTQPCSSIQTTVVRYYAQSLYYGCKYVYQSLPRLLSIWFDYAASIRIGDQGNHGVPPTAPPSGSSSSSDSSGKLSHGKPEHFLELMNNSISRMSSVVPPYVLMTAFTQLVSRLCHAHAPTWALLKEIIVQIISTHPYQTLWMTMAMFKSVNPKRRRRCLEIYKVVEQRKAGLRDTIKDYTNLTERFIDLCDKVIPKEQSRASLATVYNKLPKLIQQMGPGKVAVPFQVFMNPLLPRKGVSHKDHNPYPESLVFISDIEDTIDVMASLIRPKKITLRATNGKKYGLMCKPKDDLRKDSKVMEVNNVVNWYLSQNSESSQRRLHVRTYSVVPLNEECGLLEWVPNLTTFRQVLNSLYKERNIQPFPGQHRIHLHDDIEVKRRKFIDLWLKQTPPVFSDWFFNQFHDHQSWYTARLSYVRTAAVISIVGYIMGLGDRHCENILLDSVTGEVVHVDFNCLFNKGETFEWQERVPFRLTQNMVDGMGPLKYEGVFRKSCEIVMHMFREHKSIFLSVLRPFVFDPLVEWQKRERGSVATVEAGELTNEKAVETMKYIRHRLNGTARNMMRDINTERSVKAHVNYLIEEATSIDNLCQMWIGWAAYM